jgi:two-component system, NarL family, sensor histidine kinase EvgS
MQCAAVEMWGSRLFLGRRWHGVMGLVVGAVCLFLLTAPVAGQTTTQPARSASAPRPALINTSTDTSKDTVADGPTTAPLLAALGDRSLRVGVLADFQPFQLWPEGALGPGGADVELLNLLSAGRGPRWKLLRYTDIQRLETDLAEGRLDMAMSMARTPQRSARLAFSSPYATVEQGLIGAAELSSDTISPDLSGRTVAVLKDSAAADLVATNFPAARRVLFDSPELALRATLSKQVDLVFEALPALQQVIERERLAGLRVLRTFKFDEGRLRLAVRKGDDDLLTRLNTALAAVSPAQQADLERRWLVVPTLTSRPSRLVISEAERKMLAALPPLRVGFVKTDRPFAFVNEAGEPAGLAIELLRDLRSRLGVRLDSVKGAFVGELLDDLAQDKLDLVVGLTETAPRRQVAIFVGPYLSYPMALIAKPGSNFLGLVDLVGHTLALPRGYFPIDRIRARFPGIRIVDCGPENTCLDMVARGEADATMNNLPAAGMRLSARTAGAPLQIVGMAADIFDQHSIAIRPAFANLAPLLKRTLDEAVANDLPVLQRKWLLPQVTTGIDPKLVQRGLMAAAVLVTGLLLAWLWHTRVMAREISARREAQGRAEQASQERQRYLAFLAHEVRNSLNAVIGGLSLLRQREPGSGQSSTAMPGRISEPALMGMVDGSARSTLGLLNDLLDYHRIDAGRLTLDMRPARLANVARAVISEMQPAALEKGLTLGLEASGDLHAWHQLDTVRVGQVLRNLVANAIKFTSQGKVHVRLHVGTRLSMAVQDSGIGIAPELAQRIFEPFEQAPGQGQQGTGLGLALSRELVRAMAGDISLQSQPGAGALFIAEWPAVAAPAETLERRGTSRPLPSTPVVTTATTASPAGAGLAAAPPLGHGQRLALVVEDSPVYAVSMQAMLLQQGWQVRTAVSVDLALQAFDSQPPQLLLCDLHLADGTAFDLLSRITATRQAQGLRLEVVVMTAEPDPQDVEELRQAGADRVIEKSFDPAEMTRRVFEPA